MNEHTWFKIRKKTSVQAFTHPSFLIVYYLGYSHRVLQGDRLSLFLLNLCFSIFIQFINEEKYTKFGFSPHDAGDLLFHSIYCFQFGDDAAVVTSNECENQLLLNCFTRRCK